jgi:L-threonylcarbamoyladenylate synthase
MVNVIKISKSNKNQVIKQVMEVLANGGLVVFPSDTVYGLLVDGTQEEAVDKLIAFKNRPPGKAISVFVSDLQMANEYVEIGTNLPLLNKILPGPFTIVLPSKHTVSQKLESEKSTLGVRIPEYEYITELMREYKKPVTATSANLGGKSPHYSVESLLNQLPDGKKELIDLIVDAGKLPHNKPSTVMDLTTHEMKILRKGDILMKDHSEFMTSTPTQTKKVAQYLIQKEIRASKGEPIIIILKGDLGAGKTIFTKGIAEFFGVHNIISPTYVIYYEYDIAMERYKRFIHADLYNIQEPEEFGDLHLDEYLKEKTVMCIEWGEKLGEIYDSFKGKARIVFIELFYSPDSEKERQISIQHAL